MFELGHDLHARDHPGGHPARHGRDVLQDAVDAEAHAQLAPVGGEVDVGGAPLDRLGDDLVDELDDRRVVGGLVQVDDLARPRSASSACPPASATTSSRRSRREIRVGDVLGRGDRDAHLVAGHDRDVVDRQHIRGVGHRNQQRALVGERHRHGLVALGGGRGDEVGGGHVDREHAEVEMIEAIALGQRPREAIMGQRAAFEQHALGRRAEVARELSIASSTWPRETRPMSTITSVRNREEEPRRLGLVIPVHSLSAAGAG